jgi:hypothetical protein
MRELSQFRAIGKVGGKNLDGIRDLFLFAGLEGE